jgi:molybdate transport system ATP-binding protein
MSVLQFDCRFSYTSGFSLDLAFEIGPAMTALVGRSGAGKTTILHLIAGILTPRSGRIVIGDHTVFDSTRGINVPVYQRRVGMVFQDYQLFPHLTVESNLHYGSSRAAQPFADFTRLIEVLELAPLLARYPSTLSGGQRQRVALGRAIASQPSVLLLDEPVSALDDALKANVLRHLFEILEDFQIPLLFVTHDLDLVASVGVRTIRI